MRQGYLHFGDCPRNSHRVPLYMHTNTRFPPLSQGTITPDTEGDAVRRCGASLLELLIVLAIMLIMASMLAPGYLKMMARVETLKETVTEYLIDHPAWSFDEEG